MMTSATDSFQQNLSLLSSLGLANIEAGCQVSFQHRLAAILCYRELNTNGQYSEIIEDLKDGLKVNKHIAALVRGL